MNGLLKSFKYAIRGISAGFKGQRNIKIQTVSGALCIVAGWYLKITRLEWGIIFTCIGLVLALELMNTAIERVLDKFHPEYDEEVGRIKDISAGAVLIASLFSALAGISVFMVRIIDLFNS